MTLCALVVSLGAAGDAQSDPGNAALVGNPYNFHGSVAECAAAERSRCDGCLASHTCTPLTDSRDGDAECTELAAGDGRGYFLMCINLALAIDAVDACTARGASCPRDRHASESLSSLDANAGFLDDPACAAPLDACLTALYGAPGGASGSTPPRNTSVDCSDSCDGDSSCNAQPACDADTSCYASDDSSCSDSGEGSSCDDSGGDGGASGDSCSGDSEDSCGSEDSSSCDNSDCGGGGDSDCSSSGGGGGDCGGGGGGGDCGGGGGGGDCGGGGGGGDCNVAAKRGRTGTSLPVTLAWAVLPIPIALLVRRRAERKRARAADGEAAPADDNPEVPS